MNRQQSEKTGIQTTAAEFPEDVRVLRKLIDACFQARKLTDSLPALPDHLAISHNRVLDVIKSRQDLPEGCRVSDVAKAMNSSLPPVTRVIGDLERKGYVLKKPDPADKRVCRLVLSQKGAAFYQNYIENFHAAWAKNLGDVDPKEAKQFVRLLNRLFAAMPSSIEETKESGETKELEIDENESGEKAEGRKEGLNGQRQ